MKPSPGPNSCFLGLVLRILCLCIGVVIYNAAQARSELVVTEVMSLGSVYTVNGITTRGPDYWELTNYGSESVDLRGYRFDDNSNNLTIADAQVFENVVIQPGEAIVLTKAKQRGDPLRVITPEKFRRIWGLPDAVRIFTYEEKNGLSSAGDSVTLWSPQATTESDYLDRVSFGDATPGVSFQRDPSSGRFGALSRLGDPGARKAELSEDIGSPGVPPPRIPPAIDAQPQDTHANLGDPVVVEMAFHGLPFPHCRWFRVEKLEPIAIGSSLMIQEAQESDSGLYFAELATGGEILRSRIFSVTVNTNPIAPRFVASMGSLEGYDGQSVTLGTRASAIPAPIYTWWFNGQRIPDQTSSLLTLDPLELSNSGRYSVVASNPLGKATNTLELRVIGLPDLKITEVMSGPSPDTLGSRHMDWWELTNFEKFAIDLYGYRFSTTSGMAPSLDNAWTNTSHLVIHAGESIIFVENLASAEFVQWWGKHHLPEGLQIVGYHGPELSLSAALGDSIRLWNSVAKSDLDFVASADFGPSAPGVTFNYIPESSEFIGTSLSYPVDGVRGAFKAASGFDVGSPGYVPQRRLKLQRMREGIEISWEAEPGKRYNLQSASRPQGPWISVMTRSGTNDPRMKYLDRQAANPSARFYRLLYLP